MNADYRMYIRKITMDEGKLTSTARDEKAQSVYEMYYQYEEPAQKGSGTPCAGIEPRREGEDS